MADTFLNQERVAELWTAVKTALASKADLSELDNYTTPDAVATAITSALSNYSTNASVQTAIATALANYMTSTEVNDAITSAVVEAAGIKFEKVESLPETGFDNVIYLVPNDGDSNNVMDEYMWIDDKWELFGSTSIDLTNYWTKDELRPMTSDELKAILV